MKNVILGDGITGYIIAACLNYNNEDCIIYGNNNYQPPSILLLKYNDEEELKEYFYIFEIPFTEKNIDEYTLSISVGFTNDFCNNISDTCTNEMFNEYLNKQNRSKKTSSMSNSDKSYRAIDLKKVYTLLKNKYSKKVIVGDIDINNIKHQYNKDAIIYNTIFETDANNFTPSIEYVKVNNNDIKYFDYVYDCNKNSRIKRYTKSTIEYISNPGYYDFTIKNYYEEPTIYSKCNIKSNVTWIDISRNATKTQLKQEDIIKFMVKYE